MWSVFALCCNCTCDVDPLFQRTATEQGLSISLPPMNGSIESITSPKIDYKGKGRATPQDEEPPEDLFGTPRRQHDDEERQENGMSQSQDDSLKHEVSSPVERSRAWVVEEAEVFRKGQVLLGPEEMGEVEEGEGAQATGDELRLEVSFCTECVEFGLLTTASQLLEAQVERPRQRLLDDAVDDPQQQPQPNGHPMRRGSGDDRAPTSPR